MRSLQTYAKFKVGLFTVYQAEGRFSTVWPDTGLEKTYNYDAKVKLFFRDQSKFSSNGEIFTSPSSSDRSVRAGKGCGTPGYG